MILGWLALVTSAGTLLCCALPILLVSIGMGAVFATFTSQYPLFVTLTVYEPWMFGGSALVLGLTAWSLWKNPANCPTDRLLAERCARAQVWNRRIFFVALTFWVIGFTTAFLLLPIRIKLGI